MAVEAVIENAERINNKLTLNGSVKRGDPIAYNGTGWVQADASDLATSLYAQYIAMLHGENGDIIPGCKSCVLVDEDAPYTANGPAYVSATAGAITHDRPTADGDVIQVIGRASDTKALKIDILSPVEWEVFISQAQKDTSSEPGLGIIDAGWPGIVLTSTENCYFKGRLPSGIVGAIEAASIVFNSINASAGDLDATVVGAYDGAANDEDTGSSVLIGDWDQTDGDNKILTFDISACFDAGFYTPSRNFSVFLDPDGITAEAQVLFLYLRGFKV